MKILRAAAALAAERSGARAIVYRERLRVAALVPCSDLDQLEPPDPGRGREDPLLALLGTCADDAFVDGLSDVHRTALFSKTDTLPFGGKS